MKETQKKIIILLILNLIVFGLYFYLYLNTKQIDKEVFMKLSQIKLEINRDERLQSLKDLLGKTKDQRDKISNIFVRSDGSVEFIEMIESLGRTAGVKLEIESVGVDAFKNKIASSTEYFRLSVKSEGSWINVMHLLTLLEEMPFKVLIDNVSLSKTSAESPAAKDRKQIDSIWNGNFGFAALKAKN